MNKQEISNNIDDHVDDELMSFLELDNPASFFLFAGAGSGKTRSLVEVLRRLKEKYEKRLKMNRQQVAVITYTNAACDEIIRRLEFNAIFSVSTIHSFIWQLIEPFTLDIKSWLKINLEQEIQELEEQQKKGRASKASDDRIKKIESKTKRLQNLNQVKKFIYNPNGNNSTRDSLSHSEVIDIGANFLTTKPLMQLILVNKFPILLIDESQDTKGQLIDAFFEVQKVHKGKFSLGLLGDTMQRIYADGKENLGVVLPEDWKKPVKRMNHRCPKRVITLLNKIRKKTDGQEQTPRIEKSDGFVRVFLATHAQDKTSVEEFVKRKMVDITADALWYKPTESVKTLILEHHMSAKRLGFFPLFEPLYKADSLRTGLIDGSLPGLRFFTNIILPIYLAYQNNDAFSIAKIVRENSPLLKKEVLKQKESQLENLKKADKSIKSLMKLWENGNDPTLLEIAKAVLENEIFTIPDSLIPTVARTISDGQPLPKEKQNTELEENNDDEDTDVITTAWDIALNAKFSTIKSYNEYVSDNTTFATHQGVKGLEFPRVLVILDDQEARGFMFSYEKLIGAKEPSETDKKNVKDGKETVIDRTLRLFYVACSRAEESLAIIIYSDNHSSVSTNLINEGWFDKSEILVVPIDKVT